MTQHQASNEAPPALDVRPMAGHIGAEILGVDLSQPLDEALVAEIRSALLRWRAVFFRGQDITQAQHLALAEAFGEPVKAHPTLPAEFPDYPEILLLDNRKLGGGGGAAVGAGDGTKARGASIESRWHTDVTFVPDPPMGSILRGVVVPPYGGDTQWTNLVLAYERLSEPIRNVIDGLHAVHHNALPVKRGDLPGRVAKVFMGDGLRAVHPVVRVHPETGEKSLFVNPNFTSHIVELSRSESRHLLALLYEHMTDAEFTVRFRWEPGSIAFWDNRCTAHLVPTDIVDGMHRSMQRVTIAGERPQGPDGFVSHALES